ncbi:DUF1616 domain-containing protein [Halogeometricum limi]|uniref:Uncharacterized membrane protein n=1 Tax=Halogeometricum limi TaxID=555875 RepID=A0A1I6IKI9_9EURY|nr:DUF1616 domain-containing protein [Halogeometricum limi]SFR67242.1 Uncharacterized membrane protein [Halogeometricum limi]
MKRRPDSDRSAGAVAAFADLVVAAALSAVVVGLTMVTDPSGLLEPVRIALGALFVFVLPGYALTAALFPETHEPSSQAHTFGQPDRSTVSLTERAVLSVGLSLVVTPLIVLALNFTEFGISQVAVLNGVFGVVLVALAVAGVRRATCPPERRFRLPLSNSATGSNGGTGASQSFPKTHALIAVFLVASAGLAGAALADSQNGERYTELYLLTGNGENGTLVADEYPQTLEQTQPRSLYVGVANHEGRTVEYTVVTELQRIDRVDGERRVVAETELDRFSTTLEPGDVYRQQRSLTADSSVTGEDLRLIFLLYAGEPPEEPSEANAYREAHIWVNATAS